jgi:hypothetical protein
MLWILTAALVLTPISGVLAADPGGKPGSRGNAVVHSIRPVGTLAFDGVQGDGPGGKMEALSVAGSCDHKPFVVTKPVDRASPELMKAAATGNQFSRVVIEQAGSKVELRGVLIGMIKAGPTSNRPTESLELNFESCARK